MGQPRSVLRADGGNLRPELWRTHINDLQATSQSSPLLKLDHELQRVTALHKQATLNPNTCLADIENLARRRERPPLQTADPAYLDTRPFSFEPHRSASCVSHHSKRSYNSKGNCRKLQLSSHKSTHLLHTLAIDAQIAVAGAG